jgi:hypothetical protein
MIVLEMWPPGAYENSTVVNKEHIEVTGVDSDNIASCEAFFELVLFKLSCLFGVKLVCNRY